MRFTPHFPPGKLSAIALLGCGCLFAAATAFAGTDASKNVIEPPAPVSLDVLTIDESYVFPSPVRLGDHNIGNQSENRALIEYIRKFQIEGPWYFDIGAHYEIFSFGGSHPPAALPGALQNISMPIGVSYMIDDHAGFEFHMNPGVFYEHRVNSGAFDIPIDIGFPIPMKKDKLYLVLGVGTSVLRQYPVFPTMGIIWLINDDWQLMGYLPEPKLVYNVNKHLTAWVGAEVIGEAFKTDFNAYPITGGGRTTNGGVVDYTEIRTGVGVTYTPWKNWNFTVAAGYSVLRDFDFYRARKSLEADPAPYVRLAINAAF